VVVASGADLQSINPLFTMHPLARQVQRYALLTTLVRYDSMLTPAPYLARQWQFSEDGHQLTFTLHDGITWHDGTPTTAGDVAFTLGAARDPQTGYPRQQELSDIVALSAPDERTVTITFREPHATIPDVLTDLAILPRHVLDTIPHAGLRHAAWNESPVGNGPFRFVRHEPNRQWVFERNAAFPAALGGPPRIGRLVIAVVDEPMTKLAALTSGELDFAGIQPGHAEYVRRNGSLEVLDYPLLFTHVLAFNTRRAPLDDASFRRRLAAALDRREIVEGYAFGFGRAWQDVTGRGGTGQDVAGRDRAWQGVTGRGKAWQDVAGREKVSLELLTVGTADNALEQLIQAQLRRAGIEVVIRQMELSAFLDRVYGPAHDFDLAVLGVPGDREGAWLRALGDLTGVAVPRDSTRAAALFRDSAPVAFLFQARGVQGMNRRMRGVRMDTRGELATLQEWDVAR
jgi:peptide/nickel transport system substrate-binding protein